jgi:hypothetical protein
MIQQAGSPQRPNVRAISQQLTYQAITEVQAEVE